MDDVKVYMVVNLDIKDKESEKEQFTRIKIPGESISRFINIHSFYFIFYKRTNINKYIR